MKIKIEKLFAPFRLIAIEKIYIVWFLFVLAFGLINLFAGFLIGDDTIVKDAISSGVLYTFSISLCAPFCADIFIGFKVDKKNNKTSEFVNYKIPVVSLNIIWIVILLLLWIGIHRSNIIIQGICFLISLFFASYMYCIERMEIHPQVFENEKDSSYTEEEKERQDSIIEKSNELKKIDGEVDV